MNKVQCENWPLKQWELSQTCLRVIRHPYQQKVHWHFLFPSNLYSSCLCGASSNGHINKNCIVTEEEMCPSATNRGYVLFLLGFFFALKLYINEIFINILKDFLFLLIDTSQQYHLLISSSLADWSIFTQACLYSMHFK